MSRLACICVLNVPLSLPPLSKEWLQLSFSWLIPGFSRKQWDVLRVLLLLQGLIIERHDPFDYHFPGIEWGKEFSFEAEKCLSFPRQRDVFLYIYIKRGLTFHSRIRVSGRRHQPSPHRCITKSVSLKGEPVRTMPVPKRSHTALTSNTVVLCIHVYIYIYIMRANLGKGTTV